MIAGGLAFRNVQGYVATNSGSNLVAEFRNEGSSTSYATGKFDLNNGNYYSVFLTGDGQSARVKVFNDDLTVGINQKLGLYT